MASAVLAYAFLKACYDNRVSNYLDVLIPLVKRALMKYGSREIDAAVLQEKIGSSVGLKIPINVIRFSFPKLRSEGVLSIDDIDRRYKLVNKDFVDSSILELEKQAREQYQYIIRAIARVLVDEGTKNLTADEVLIDWLDTSGVSFLGDTNPAFGAGFKDSNVHRIVLLAIRTDPHEGKFLSNLTDVALGDALYRAVIAMTEVDADQPGDQAFRGRMDDVTAYLDTAVVLRILGRASPELVQAAEEFVQLCRGTNCRLAVFPHNVEEIRRIHQGAAAAIRGHRAVENQLARWAFENYMSAADVIELAAALEDDIRAAGIEIVEAPPLTEELSVDERGLRLQLQIDLKQSEEGTRDTDVKSLTAIFRAREGRGFKYVEKCRAIFITTNKGLADSSVRFFRNHFREEREKNIVQICMTDVVFATRLWTKLPSVRLVVPRYQIISHILSNLRPNVGLKQSFQNRLQEQVRSGRLTEEEAVKLQLSRFIDETLALEYDARKESLSNEEFASVVSIALKEQVRLKDNMIAEARAEEQKKYLEQMTLQRDEISRLRDRVASANEETKKLSLQYGVETANAALLAEKLQENNRVAVALSNLVFFALCFGAIFFIANIFFEFVDLSSRIASDEPSNAFAALSAAAADLANRFGAAVLALAGATGIGLTKLRQRFREFLIKILQSNVLL